MADDQAKSASFSINKIASEFHEPESIFARLTSQPPTNSEPSPREAPVGLSVHSTLLVPPRTWVEEKLFEIWVSMLGFDDFGVGHDFFELGGHSLLATQILSRAQETFGIEIPMNLLWMNEIFSVESMAAVIEQILIGEAPHEQLVAALQDLDELSAE